MLTDLKNFFTNLVLKQASSIKKVRPKTKKLGQMVQPSVYW